MRYKIHQYAVNLFSLTAFLMLCACTGGTSEAKAQEQDSLDARWLESCLEELERQRADTLNTENQVKYIRETISSYYKSFFDEVYSGIAGVRARDRNRGTLHILHMSSQHSTILQFIYVSSSGCTYSEYVRVRDEERSSRQKQCELQKLDELIEVINIAPSNQRMRGVEYATFSTVGGDTIQSRVFLAIDRKLREAIWKWIDFDFIGGR